MNVAMVDLLTQTPFYDRDLSEALAPLADQFTLYAVRFQYELDYFDNVAFSRSPGLMDCVSSLQIKTRPLRQVGKVVEYGLNWSYLLHRFRQEPPDVVHIQWLPLLSRTDWELRAVEHIQRLGIVVLYTAHNYLPHELSPYHYRRYLKAYTLVDHIIVHTQADKERLAGDFGISVDKLSVVPLGPSLGKQANYNREQARAALGLQRNEVVFLMLGVIRPYKGTEETIQALAQVLKSCSGCSLIVAGQALDQGYLRYLQVLASELGVQSHIQWRIRYIHSSEIGFFHAAADVVLFPYREISQSAALLTAAALGKCTLTTKVGGLAEIVRDGETGLQVDSSDPAKLAAGLQRCIELAPAECARMGNALRAYVQRYCNWGLIAQQTVDVYHQMLRGNN